LQYRVVVVFLDKVKGILFSMGNVTHSFIARKNNFSRLLNDMTALNSNYVKIGFPEGQKVGAPSKSKKDSSKPYKDMSEVARVAAWNEFGTPTIPSRPFFRNFLHGSKQKYAEVQKKILAKVQEGSMTTKDAFESMGLWGQKGIRQSIRDMLTPENVKSTVKAKHSSHPLIDTSQMINSVTFVTVKSKMPKEESVSL
jgi:hypothetical protein